MTSHTSVDQTQIPGAAIQGCWLGAVVQTCSPMPPDAAVVQPYTYITALQTTWSFLAQVSSEYPIDGVTFVLQTGLLSHLT